MNFSLIKILFLHEFRMDMRNKSSLFATLLYTICAIFVCFLSFGAKQGNLHILVWNALFWIISLFSCMNAMTRNMAKESENQALYYYQIVSPQTFIVAKMAYNLLFLTFLGFLSFLFQSLVLGNQIQDNLLYLFAIIISMVGFSCILTLVSSIASKAKNNTTLMAVLSLPILIPLLLLAIKLSKNAIDGLELASCTDEIITILAIDAITMALAFLLYPFLWKN